jgi:F-type H+-transporting ATPase subunit epsilon
LADSAVRAAELDEAAAVEAKQRAEEAMQNANSEIEIAKAQTELAIAVAEINMISHLKDRLHKTGLAK